MSKNSNFISASVLFDYVKALTINSDFNLNDSIKVTKTLTIKSSEHIVVLDDLLVPFNECGLLTSFVLYDEYNNGNFIPYIKVGKFTAISMPISKPSTSASEFQEASTSQTNTIIDVDQLIVKRRFEKDDFVIPLSTSIIIS